MNKLLFFVLLFCRTINVYCFDYTVKLDKNAFVYQKYNFYIQDVYDCRLVPKKPIGILKGDLSKEKIVGNSTLADDLKTFFSKDTSSFSKSTRIILVINQLNLLSCDMDFGFTLGLDYYKIKGDSAVLVYSQFTKQSEDQKLNTQKYLNKTFSKALEMAFLDFKNQLWYYKALNSEAVKISELEKIIRARLSPDFNTQIMKDGIYTNINQLRLNQPVVTSGYILRSDTSLKQRRPTYIKNTSLLIKKAFSIVRKGQIYIYFNNNTYYPASLDSSGSMFLKKVYLPSDDREFHSTASSNYLDLLFVLLSALAYDPSKNFKDIKVDVETGGLSL